MKVLLVDDDHDLVDLLRHAFQRDGYKVVTAYDGEVALQVFQLETPNLVLLDLALPKRNGIEVLKEIRRRSNTPVLILSVQSDEEKVVEALDQGADEYLFKPFRLRELRARTRALLRRGHGNGTGHSRPAEAMTFGDLRVDPRSHQVTVAGHPVRLTPTEFALLQYLLANHDVVVKSTDIIANVWNYDAEDTGELVRVFISRLRRKIESDPACPHYILNVPGVGYMFQSKPDELLDS
jgi:DNA-binding response OmpR family regulator